MQRISMAVTAALLLVTTEAAANVIVIDDFSVPGGVNRSGANTISGNGVQSDTIFGGRRGQGVENSNLGGGSWLEISWNRADAGELFFTTNRDGRMRLSYGGGAFALGDVTGLGVNAFEIGVEAMTTSTAFDFSVEICDDQDRLSCFDAAIEGVSPTSPVAGGPPFTLTIPFSSFASEADFTDVHWLFLYAQPVDPGTSNFSELVLSEFQFASVAEVPLPAPWALIAVGGAALALMRRRTLSS